MRSLMLENKTNIQIDAAACTDRGQKRELNEDVAFCQTSQTPEGQKNVGLYLVCDGMGGHKAGKVASQLAAGTIMAKLTDLFLPVNLSGDSNPSPPSSSNLRELVKEAIQAANHEILNYAQKHPQEAGNMGTTATVALLYNDWVYIGNVGDSRTYVWRSGQMTQLTQDHSLAAVLAKLGKQDKNEIANHPGSKVLLRALGLDTELEIDLFSWRLKTGDKLLLCSNGLWKAFPDASELAERLDSDAGADDLCRQLIAEANQRDGSDNISAVVVNTQEVSSWQFNLAKSVTNIVQKVMASAI